jgi:S1-C subfamily serine protease
MARSGSQTTKVLPGPVRSARTSRPSCEPHLLETDRAAGGERATSGDLPAATLCVSADFRIGQPVIAVGSPLGLNGNSGGPLVDLDGWVVGINTSIATLGGRSSGNIGIGFAVPIGRAADVAQRIIARG